MEHGVTVWKFSSSKLLLFLLFDLICHWKPYCSLSLLKSSNIIKNAKNITQINKSVVQATFSKGGALIKKGVFLLSRNTKSLFHIQTFLIELSPSGSTSSQYAAIVDDQLSCYDIVKRIIPNLIHLLLHNS